MTTAVSLGSLSEQIIEDRLATGRYRTASEVVEEALRLLAELEKAPSPLDRAIMRGLADIEAGRVHDADEVFDELEAELASLASQS